MGFEDPSCTIFVKNLEPRVTEELLWELFIQAGPLKSVKIPSNRTTGEKRNFAFVSYRDDVSVSYACEMFNQVRLFKKPIYCNPSNRDPKSSFNQSTDSAGPASPSSPTSSNNSLIHGILNRSNSTRDRDNPVTSTPFNGKRKFSSVDDDRVVILDNDKERNRYNQHDDRNRRDFFGGNNSRDERDNSAYRSNDRKFSDRSSSQGSRYDRSNSYNSSYGNTSPMHVQALNQSQHRQFGGRGNNSPRNNDYDRSPRGDFGGHGRNDSQRNNNRRQR